VNYSEHLNAASPEAINQAITLYQQFTDFGIAGFGHVTPASRKHGKLIDRQNEAFYQGLGILGRVSGNVILNIFQICNGGIGPFKSGHFFRKRFLTSS